MLEHLLNVLVISLECVGPTAIELFDGFAIGKSDKGVHVLSRDVQLLVRLEGFVGVIDAAHLDIVDEAVALCEMGDELFDAAADLLNNLDEVFAALLEKYGTLCSSMIIVTGPIGGLEIDQEPQHLGAFHIESGKLLLDHVSLFVDESDQGAFVVFHMLNASWQESLEFR